MLLTLVLLSVAIIIIIYWLVKRQYGFWKSLQVPYIEPVFPLGNLTGVGHREHLMTRLATFYTQYKTKYPIIGMFFFFRPAVLIMDQDLLKNIFIKDAHNFNDRAHYHNEKYDPISAHLFSIHGPKWRMLRSKLTPTFTSGKMKYMFSTIVEVMNRLEHKFESEIDSSNDILEIKGVMARYTTDVIGTCAFGIECNSMAEQNSEFRSMGVKIFDNPKFGFFTSLLLLSIRDLAQNIGIKSIRTDVSKFFTGIVKETVNYRETNNVKRKDFMDLLIDLKKNSAMTDDPLTMNELTAQAFIFFAAGFETSSTLLTFCFYVLSLNPDIQEKTRQHIEDILKKHNDQLTYEAMMDMKYLDQVLNETLRLYSPLSMILRIAENDYKVPNTEYILKKGSLAVISTYAIHHDPEFYPNPMVFNPDNFTEENIQNRPTTSFLPFGEGPRNCIGARFGMMQARLGLIGALRKFKFALAPTMNNPVKIAKNKIITSPEGGMWLRVQRL